MPLFAGSCFRLEYPPHWEAEIIEDIPAFYDPQGSGAVQVAAVHVFGPEVELEQEMSRYLARHGIAYEAEGVTAYRSAHGHEAMAVEFVSKERFWLATLLTDGQRLLIITYNSDEVPETQEAYLISSVINSICFEEDVEDDIAD